MANLEWGVHPAKRKRFSIQGPEESLSQVSFIEELRVPQGKALRLNCSTLCIRVGPPLIQTGSQDDDPDSTQRELANLKATPSAQPSMQESFHVHEYVLTDSSPFFASAMKPQWATARPDPRTIDLPDDDPAAFSLYMSWLYTRKLPVLTSSTDTPGDVDESYHTLAYAYVLGERLLDTGFKNAIVDAYVLYARGSTTTSHQPAPPLPSSSSPHMAPPRGPSFPIPFPMPPSPPQNLYHSYTSLHSLPTQPTISPSKRHYPSNEEIRILYAGTSHTSPIRKLLVDIWCCRGKADWLAHDEDLPPDFLVEVTRGLLRNRAGAENGVAPSLSRPWKNSHVQYHEIVKPSLSLAKGRGKDGE